MTNHCTPILAAAATLALILASCGDDSPTGNGPSDTTPPSIVDLTPVDVYHLGVTFSEEVAPASAEDVSNYEVVEFGSPAPTTAPGDAMYVVAAVIQPDGKTVSLTTYASMSGLTLTMIVDGVVDFSGNAVRDMRKSFVGSDLPDEDPPQIIRTTPAAGAVGVPIGTSVTVRFSEWIDDDTFREGVTWDSASGPVRAFFDYSSGGNATYTLYTPDLLEYDTEHTVAITGVKDRSGNTMADAIISFTTTDVPDDTPPMLVSSYPRDGATRVDENTQVSLTFSEPINRHDFHYESVPEIIFGDWNWSNGDRTVTLTQRDWDPLANNRQYRVIVYPGGVFDLGGNTLGQYQTVTFSTGSELERGSLEGEITGDAGTAAADPTGAVVFAESFWSLALTIVELNDTYEIPNLEFGGYYLRAYLDTNHDGLISVYWGDALGGYGVDPALGDFELEAVPVPEGRHVRNIDFLIYDPTAVSGIVTYAGEIDDKPIGIGLFATPTDAINLTNPVATTRGWWPYSEDWVFNEFFQGFSEGDYYVAAYIDADSSGAYEPGTDPAGVYGGVASPISVRMVNGLDYFDVVIPVDFAPARVSAPVKWPAPRYNVEMERLAKVPEHRGLTAAHPASTRERAP